MLGGSGPRCPIRCPRGEAEVLGTASRGLGEMTGVGRTLHHRHRDWSCLKGRGGRCGVWRWGGPAGTRPCSSGSAFWGEGAG